MTLLRPAGAAALLAVPLLVALWLWDRRRRVVDVPTLLFWRQLPAAPATARHLPTDPLFLLELALVLALAAGYLRPALPTDAARGSSLVVVLDVSASMGAREAAGTRFALARRRARALIAERAEEVMLVAAAERPRVALRWTDDAALVLSTLETLEPLDVAGDLTPALALALAEARVRPGARVAVFTDLPRAAAGVAPDELAALHWVQIGRTDDNVAIASLAVDAPPFHDRAEATATVVVRNHGARPRRARLEASVGGVAWEYRELTLAARAAETLVLAHPPAAGELDVTLVADDALPADDVARAWVPERAPPRLVVVAESAALAPVLRALPGARVEVVTPAAWAAAPAADADVVVFDEVAPATGVVNALWVAPPPGSGPCPSDGEVTGAAVVDWEDDHPALAGLDGLEATPVARARRLVAPEWAAPVVLAAAAGRTFPLLVAGERDGRRTACLGASLDGALGTSDGLPLLLLTLGTLGWLADAGAPLVVDTGTPVVAGPGVVAAPGLRVAGDVVVAERAGTYRVGARLLLANLLDDHESDIGRDGGGEWAPAVVLAASAGAAGARELGAWLYAVAAALLALEWLVWLRRRA